MRFKGFEAEQHGSLTHSGGTVALKRSELWRALGAGETKEMKNRSKAKFHIERFTSSPPTLTSTKKSLMVKRWGKNKPKAEILESHRNISERWDFCCLLFYSHSSLCCSPPQFHLHRQHHSYFLLKWHLRVKRLLPCAFDLFINSLSQPRYYFPVPYLLLSLSSFSPPFASYKLRCMTHSAREETSADGLILHEWSLTHLQYDYLPFMSI